MNNKLNLISILIALSLQTGCFYAVRYDGPYHGKVVDKETREPIEGAVVLGTWYTETPTLAGAIHNYYDARETVTDKNGEFSIPGQGLRIMSRLLPMSAVIFKAGYSYYGTGNWDTIKTGMFSKEEIKWEGDMPIFPLKKLAMEERKRQIVPTPPHQAQKNKIRIMVDEINKDLLECGQGTIDIGR